MVLNGGEAKVNGLLVKLVCVLETNMHLISTGIEGFRMRQKAEFIASMNDFSYVNVKLFSSCTNMSSSHFTLISKGKKEIKKMKP